MKKATLQEIHDLLVNWDECPERLIEEINAELNKGKAQKDKNAEAYESFHELLVSNLCDTPATCGEIYEAIADELPEGVTKGKVQYALSHLWQDEIVKIEGKPNTYRKA